MVDPRDFSLNDVPVVARAARSVSDILEETYHILVLFILAAYMLAVRLQTYGRFVTDSGVYFSGNDPWYHYRAVKYSIANWPFTIPFDPLTGFPDGAAVGQFGTLFDQILATVILVLGLGSPSDELVRTVMVLAPPVIGALCLIPVYAIGKQLHSRRAGVIGAFALAMTPGVFLSRSLVGVADHNIAEPLFMLIAVSVVIYAFKKATTDVLVSEVLLNTDRQTLLSELTPGILAGFAVAAYLLVWPPGVLLVGILAISYTGYAVVASVSDQQVEPVLLVGVVSNLTLSVVLALNIETFQLSSTRLGPVQIGLAAATALWCGILIAGLRWLDDRELPAYAFGGATVATVAVGFGAVNVLTPELWQFVYSNLIRVVGFGQHAGILTIGEGQPFVGDSGFVPTVVYNYGLLLFTGALGAAFIAGRGAKRLREGEPAPGDLLVLVWAVVITLAAFTQVRFNYYLAPVTAILVGYALARSLDVIGFPDARPNLEAYQYVSLVLVLLVVFVPVLAFPVDSSTATRAQAHDVGEYTAWEEPLEWMNTNTPEYDSLDTYGTYQEPADGSYDYESDVYGVMSWWDYGHYTSTTAERVPVANPFQQNARESARFLLAENESNANAVLTEMGAENTRYVAVDWKMVTPSSKFSAPVVWHPSLSRQDMFDAVYQTDANGQPQARMTTLKQRYFDSLAVRLYSYHGSAKQPAPVAIDYETRALRTQDGQQLSIKTAPKTNDTNPVFKRFENAQQATQFADRNKSAHVGGFGLQPRERVPALNHYRLVKTSEETAFSSRSYQNALQNYARFGQVQYSDFTRNGAWVKLFERVPGAKVNGENGPANATVLAQVEIQDPDTNTTFNYVQYAQTDTNGEFQMTVPYSTTGYDQYGPDNGQTNLSVRATGSYEFVSLKRTFSFGSGQLQPTSVDRRSATADVPEGAVNGATNTTVTVTLEKET
jgi:dolichyl-diphosphooligosaccharide--protein glycosyltransferase